MNKKLRIAFLTSIILNFLLVGVIVGHLPQQFSGKPSGNDRFSQEVEKLPEPARSRLREKLDQFRKTPLRDQMRQEREETIRLLVADPFDEAAYQRQVAKLAELRSQMAERMGEDIRDVVKRLPADQRNAVAELLKRPSR